MLLAAASSSSMLEQPPASASWRARSASSISSADAHFPMASSQCTAQNARLRVHTTRNTHAFAHAHTHMHTRACVGNLRRVAPHCASWRARVRRASTAGRQTQKAMLARNATDACDAPARSLAHLQGHPRNSALATNERPVLMLSHSSPVSVACAHAGAIGSRQGRGAARLRVRRGIAPAPTPCYSPPQRRCLSAAPQHTCSLTSRMQWTTPRSQKGASDSAACAVFPQRQPGTARGGEPTM